MRKGQVRERLYASQMSGAGGRPGHPSTRLQRAHARELAYLQSGELVTPCRLFLVLICSIMMVLLISLSATDKEFQYESDFERLSDVNMSQRPYVFDYKSMQQARDDLMAHYGHSKPSRRVEKRSGLSLDEFFDLYDGKWPVIVTDIIPNWDAYKLWGKEYFIQKYGADRIVLKAVQGQLQDGVAHVRDMTTFISYLDQASFPDAWTYMEDEMFLMLRPELRADIGANYLMDENFFNIFPLEIRPWDCMMLWGSKYSRSTLHMDPYNWTAVSAVVWGRKLWKGLWFGMLHHVTDEHEWTGPCGSQITKGPLAEGRNTKWLIKGGAPHDALTVIVADERFLNQISYFLNASNVDAYNPDYWRFPKFRRAEYIEVEQNSGELLIIPSGWYHQAFNDEETMSVSTQMMNRNNYLAVLEEIIKGKNLNRKKLPPHFNTLLPPDQVKLFMSLIPKKILKSGKEVTDSILGNMDIMNKNREQLDQPLDSQQPLAQQQPQSPLEPPLDTSADTGKCNI